MSRRASKRDKRFDVFEFTDEDEKIERDSAKILSKFGNPKKCRHTPSHVDKYKFLQCFSRPNESRSTSIGLEKTLIDVDIEDGSGSKQNEVHNWPIQLDAEVKNHRSSQSRKTWAKKNFNGPIEVDTEVIKSSKTREKKATDGPIDVDAEVLQSSKTREKKISHGPIDIDAEEMEATRTHQISGKYKFGDTDVSVTGQRCTFPACCPVNIRQEEISNLDTPLESFPSNYENERVHMISDDDGRIEMSPSSAIASYVECTDSPREQLSAHSSDGYQSEMENVKVVISPDFIVYRNIYCTACQLTFSKTSLKVEGLTVNGNKEKFSFVWTVGEITSIEAKWYERDETAIVNLVLQSKWFKRAGNANETPAVDVLKFAVYDPSWSERQEAIKSLSVGYKDRWNTLSDENGENAFMGQNSRFLPKPCIPVFDEHFKQVIYPKGDSDAVSISKRDFELLQPETFINDNIIDFYMKYLKNKIQPEEQHRFHFFNSFFFRKLADQDKGLSSVCQAKAAFQRVHKWTRNVDIFEKDYIFIPVNYSFHWSLIVICHPGEVANLKDNETEKLVKVPCILHMDSIRGSHRGLKNIFRSYLSEEWKERHREAADDVPSNFVHLQFVPLELPQQENSFDCGLFLLHYVELFLLQAPTNFSPFKIMGSSSNFLSMKWFPPAEASLKRSHIQKLIYEILEEQSPSSTSADNLLPSQIGQDTGVQFIGQISGSGETSQDYSSNCKVKQGSNKFSLAVASPPTALQIRNGSGLEIHECYEGGVCGVMSPVEEIEEIGEKTMADSSSEVHGQQDAASVSEPCLSTRHLSEDFGVLRTPQNQHKPLHSKDLAFDKSGDFLDSSEVRLEEDQHHPEFEVSSHQETTDKPESSSASFEVYSDSIVKDSEDSTGMYDDIESTCSFLGDISRFRINLADLTAKAHFKRNTRRDSSDRDYVSEGE